MNKKLKLVFIIIVVAFLVLSSFIIIEPREHSKSISETDFTSNLQINVLANLTNNSLYTTSSLYNPDVVYQNILENMTVYISGNFLSSGPQSVIISYSVYIDSTSPSWSKTFYSNITTFEFTDSHTINSIVIPVNLTYLYDQAAAIDGELGYNSAPATVGINATVTNINSGAQSSTGMSITQENRQFDISYGAPAGVTGTVKIMDSYGQKPVLNIPIMYGYAIAAISGVLFVVLVTSYEDIPKKKSKLEIILQEYSDRIIDIDAMPKGSVVKVDSFTELVKLSDAYHEPLFNIKTDNLFFVSHDFRNYVFFVTGDRK